MWADGVSAASRRPFGRRVNAVASTALLRRAARDPAAQRGIRHLLRQARACRWPSPTFMAVTADYIYYRYDFPAGYDLPAGVPSEVDRQRLQVGVEVLAAARARGRAGARRAAPPTSEVNSAAGQEVQA